MSNDLVKRLRDTNGGWASDEALVSLLHIEELESKLRESALQELSALGQATEAYQAQLEAEAKLEAAVEALENTTQILDQCTFATIRVKGQYLDRKEIVAHARAILALMEDTDDER